MVGPVALRSPVDQFSFGDGKAHSQAGAFGFQYGILFLKKLNVTMVGT